MSNPKREMTDGIEQTQAAEQKTSWMRPVLLLPFGLAVLVGVALLARRSSKKGEKSE